MSDTILLTPGPVQVPKKVLEGFASPAIHHRTPEFDQILKDTRAKLKQLFHVSRPVHILTSTGSGAMEAAVVNFLSKNSKALVVVSGKFGERWAEMLEAYEVECIRLNVNWGESIDLKTLEDALKSHSNLDAVFCQMCETSTGALHPIEEMGKKIKALQPNCLFLVDAITGILTKDVDIINSSIDVLVAGSQKAFMLPTGISFLYMSEMAEKICMSSNLPRFYFDLRKELSALNDGQTFFSSPVSHIKALNICADLILEKGLKSHFSHIEELAKATRNCVKSLGLNLFPNIPAPALSAIVLPSSIDGKKFRNTLESKYKLVAMGGQDQLSGKIIRIGHIGDVSFAQGWEAMSRFIDCLEDFSFPVDKPSAKKAFFEGKT